MESSGCKDINLQARKSLLQCEGGESFGQRRFSSLFDPVRKKAYDSQLDEGARLSVYNSQTVCDHLQMKAIWPTTARDFLNLVRWRVVSSDTAVIICFGIPGSRYFFIR